MLRISTEAVFIFRSICRSKSMRVVDGVKKRQTFHSEKRTAEFSAPMIEEYWLFRQVSAPRRKGRHTSKIDFRYEK